MKRVLPIFTILLCLLVLSGCDTYKTYYGETQTGHLYGDSRGILRLDLSSSEQSLGNPANLKGLRMLNLSSRKELVIDQLLEAIPNPLELEILILDSLHFNKLPSSITRFKNLRQISLNANPQLNLEAVIASIEKLPIEFLNFQANDLKEIPKSISSLEHLEDLNLSNNNLNTFDHFEFLATLRNLSSLWLTNNSLTELPESLGSLEQLRNLYIEHNMISHFSETMAGMKSLWVLHAGHNQFTELSPTFALMPRLTLLHINNCLISVIPEVFRNKRKYPILGLIIDSNKLDHETKSIYRKEFDHFFILSF